MSFFPKNDQHDLRAYVAAAYNLIAGRPLYARYRGLPEDSDLTTDIPYFIYPPLVAILFTPSTLFRFDTFRKIWYVICQMFAVIAICCVSPNWYIGCIAGGLLFAGYPWLWHQRCGQIDIFVYMLVAIGYALYANGVYPMAGFIIALACWVKVTPGIIGLYFTIACPTFGAWWATWGLVFFAIQAVICPRELFAWFHRIREVAHWKYDKPAVQSLMVLMPSNVCKICTSSMLLAGVFTVSDPLTGVALCCICMMLIPNIGWIMQFSGMVIPYVVLLNYFYSGNPLAFLPLCIVLIQPKLCGPGWSALVTYITLFLLHHLA